MNIPTMQDALDAGDGTLHGAIDHWQNECARLTARVAGLEKELSALKAAQGEPVADRITVRAAAIDWLKQHYPALCEKAGLCERIGGRLYTRTFLAHPELPVDVVKDAERYRWLRRFPRKAHRLLDIGGRKDELDAAIDAVIAASQEKNAIINQRGTNGTVGDVPDDTA